MGNLLTAAQVAEIFGIKKKSVYQKVYRNELPYIRLGGKNTLRFDSKDIENYINNSRRETISTER